jgi:2'-5' RNA ligase
VTKSKDPYLHYNLNAMRLFFALDIDAAIRERITAYVDGVRRIPAVRFMPPESYHVTLKFLGEVKDLDRVEHAATNLRAESFNIAFRGTGFFPNARSPRIFWAGIHADNRLPALASALDEDLASAGFPREERPFQPHLTLARSGSGDPRPRRDERPVTGFRALVHAVEKNPAPEFGTMAANEFCLYESKLSPHGAQYTKLARYPLA